MGSLPGPWGWRPPRLLVVAVLLWLSPGGAQGDCSAPPRQPHASIKDEKDSYPVGSVVRYTCIPGYQYVSGARPTVQCLATSTWSTIPQVCERKQCKVPALENGGIDAPTGLGLGDEVTFHCDKGFRLIGQKTSRCTLLADGKVDWNRDPPYCERIPCVRPPEIANGRHSGDVALDHYVHGDAVTYYCDKDFSLIGHPTIICETAADGRTGRWNRSPPQCKVVNCNRPQIANGRLTSAFQPTYKYDHVLQFVCNAGYTLVFLQLPPLLEEEEEEEEEVVAVAEEEEEEEVVVVVVVVVMVAMEEEEEMMDLHRVQVEPLLTVNQVKLKDDDQNSHPFCTSNMQCSGDGGSNQTPAIIIVVTP
ncbi:hypothetical protein JD844_018443 [Phrynosoma platyrhinos]|uniref:Sushi domain-containing protein n=1 Tax=Phrynosoma platyrhinos TaxID=52577 RepID=A0ABQ7SNM8_PHRPL|nr:hypothetical protein JD844_018443 [Phrynosoma platyrhinos]